MGAHDGLTETDKLGTSPRGPFHPCPLFSSPAAANCSLIRIMVSWCLHVSSTSSQSFNNTKHCASSHPLAPLLSLSLSAFPFSNWEPLVHTGDPESSVPPWAGRPRGSGAPCADSRSVNRADGFWQIHSDWKSFILQDFFLPLFFFSKKTPHAQKELSIYLWTGHWGVRQFVPWPFEKTP